MAIKSCSECKSCGRLNGQNVWICRRTATGRMVYLDTIPDWCPLPPADAPKEAE
jgi:hypothetical protein